MSRLSGRPAAAGGHRPGAGRPARAAAARRAAGQPRRAQPARDRRRCWAGSRRTSTTVRRSPSWSSPTTSTRSCPCSPAPCTCSTATPTTATIGDVVDGELLTHLYGTDGPGRAHAAGRAVHEEPLMAPSSPRSATSRTGSTSCRPRSCATPSSAAPSWSSRRGCSATSSSSARARSPPTPWPTSASRAPPRRSCVGLPVTLGLAVFCIAGGLAIGFLGRAGEQPGDRHRHGAGLRHRARRAVRSLASKSSTHRHQRAVRQPAGHLLQPDRRLRALHGRHGGRDGGHRPAADLRVGRRAGRRGQGRAGAGARRRLPAAPGARHHHGGAGGRARCCCSRWS